VVKKINLLNPDYFLKNVKASDKKYGLKLVKQKDRLLIKIKRNKSITDEIKIPYSRLLKHYGIEKKLNNLDLSNSNIGISRGGDQVEINSGRSNKRKPQAYAIHNLLKKIRGKGWLYPERISHSERELKRNRQRFSRAYKKNYVDRERNIKDVDSKNELKVVKYRYKLSKRGKDYLRYFNDRS